MHNGDAKMADWNPSLHLRRGAERIRPRR